MLQFGNCFRIEPFSDDKHFRTLINSPHSRDFLYGQLKAFCFDLEISQKSHQNKRDKNNK